MLMFANLFTLPDNPLVALTILLGVILAVPPVFERLRLPGLVGLLAAGVAIGGDGLGLLDKTDETISLLSDVGKIYLMFVAGLEIDLADFRRQRNRALGFGLLTFLIPLISGTALGQLVGFGLNTSILIGSLIASHTLLGYPIVSRLGIASNSAVIATIGATIFTDIAALLVLAVCISIHVGDFTASSLIVQLMALGLYSACILIGIDWLGKEFFRRTGEEESNQFLFVLLAVFLSSVGAQLIDVDKIVGAFLAGLAVNDVVGHSPVEEKIEFVGSTLFIPCFFVGMGLTIDIDRFTATVTTNLGVTVALVVALLASKFVAAAIAKMVFGYRWNEMLTMWSLSLPQVAATLAAALAGVNAGLLPETMFDAVIVLMLVTALTGPLLTGRFAKWLLSVANDVEGSPGDARVVGYSNPSSETAATLSRIFNVLVPVSNPVTERNLIEMGALLAQHEDGQIVPLAIARGHIRMDAPELTDELDRSSELLRNAVAIGREFGVESHPVTRITDDIARGIVRCAREQDVNLIVMGWSARDRLTARLFGNVVDGVFWAAHCPVAVVKLLKEPVDISTILVPVKNITPQALRTVQFAMIFASTHQADVVLLHVFERKVPDVLADVFKADLTEAVETMDPRVPVSVRLVCSDDTVRSIVDTAEAFDLVVLRSMRRRTAGGLAVSDVTTMAISKIDCSMVLLGEPNDR